MRHWTMLSLLIVLCFFLVSRSTYHDHAEFEHGSKTLVDHPLIPQLYYEIRECHKEIAVDCTDQHITSILNLCTRIANEHMYLLLYDRAQEVFKEIAIYVDNLPELNLDRILPPDNNMSFISSLSKRVAHIRAVLAFSEGDSYGVS